MIEGAGLGRPGRRAQHPPVRRVAGDGGRRQVGAELEAAEAERLANRLRERPEVAWVVPNERERRLQVPHRVTEEGGEQVLWVAETLAADMVLKAIGQKLDSSLLADCGLTLRDGRVVADDDGRTGVAGLYAGGDCRLGGRDLTVEAVEDGKRAALATLYPGARQVWVDSGHGIPMEKPQAVVAAIHEAVRAAARDAGRLRP